MLYNLKLNSISEHRYLLFLNVYSAFKNQHKYKSFSRTRYLFAVRRVPSPVNEAIILLEPQIPRKKCVKFHYLYGEHDYNKPTKPSYTSTDNTTEFHEFPFVASQSK